jgi:hypothetical protein
MFGLRFIKVQPNTYLIQYSRAKVKHEGTGLAFFYYGPTSSLVAVPVSSIDTPFIFKEITADFQEVTIQGQVTFRIAEPKRIAELMNFALDASGLKHVSEDPQKLPQRLLAIIQVLTRAEVQDLPLRSALRASDSLVRTVVSGLRTSEAVMALGLEILGLSILAIKPTAETARALEAEVREQLLREADQAIYARRNAAVEQERAIKENELNTEIAVENKKRQIREAQMDVERAVQEKQQEMKKAELDAQIELEAKRQDLVKLAAQNAREDADTKAYAMAALLQPIAALDPKVLQALASTGMEPRQLIAQAFRELSENAAKIGELNISPELLQTLLSKGK